MSEEECHSLIHLTDGDYLAVCPVIAGEGEGKDIARAISAIAIMIVSAGAGSAVAGAMYGGS